jgi:hypothetical protein
VFPVRYELSCYVLLRRNSVHILNYYKFFHFLNYPGGHSVAQLVEELCYKLEDRGFNSQ